MITHNVVTCQRYICHNVIPLTMTVLIYHCIIVIVNVIVNV